jgi:hypothetical protein
VGLASDTAGQLAEASRRWDVPRRQVLGSLQVLPLKNGKGEDVAGRSERGVRTQMFAGPDDTLGSSPPPPIPTRWTLSKEAWARLVCGWAGRPDTCRVVTVRGLPRLVLTSPANTEDMTAAEPFGLRADYGARLFSSSQRIPLLP